MLGMIEFDGSDGKETLEQRRMLGGRFLVLNMGRGAKGPLSGYRAVRAARRMRERGVRTAVFPVDFPHTAAFFKQGIAPADPLPLRRALCAGAVGRRLTELGISRTEAVVAVAGEYLSREMEETARALALEYRYVMLAVKSGGEEFAKRLRREYGVSLLLNPSSEQLERSDALVLFAPCAGLRQDNRVLCAVYPGGEFGRGGVSLRLGEEVSGAVSSNCSTEQLAAALYGMGVLPPGMLTCEITC